MAHFGAVLSQVFVHMGGQNVTVSLQSSGLQKHRPSTVYLHTLHQLSLPTVTKVTTAVLSPTVKINAREPKASVKDGFMDAVRMALSD
jgi:hypothetical protein